MFVYYVLLFIRRSIGLLQLKFISLKSDFTHLQTDIAVRSSNNKKVFRARARVIDALSRASSSSWRHTNLDIHIGLYKYIHLLHINELSGAVLCHYTTTATIAWPGKASWINSSTTMCVWVYHSSTQHRTATICRVNMQWELVWSVSIERTGRYLISTAVSLWYRT